MKFPPQLIKRFFRSIVIGAFVGIVFSILFLALPGAGLLLLVSSLNLGWNLQWYPSVAMIMAIGAIGGGVFSAALFIKDQYIPYVEQVPDFEADAEDPDFHDR